ncbi:protein PHLOEM PROTEIN [Salix suchowensis]|nr:protein PHLOEM PROTEIN [Salix suchowensis]
MSSKESDHEAEPDEILKIENKSWKFKPRGFSITCSRDKYYWNIPEKGTDDPAELRQVCLLEVKGSSPEPLLKGARYALSFKISLTENKFGWGEAPAFMMAKVGKKGRAKWARINLADVEENTEMEVPFGKLRFEVPPNAEDTILNFGLYELWNGGWKGGLLIHEAVVEEMPD